MTSSTGSQLLGVSCPTATLCKAVGNNDTIVSWNGTSHPSAPTELQTGKYWTTPSCPQAAARATALS